MLINLVKITTSFTKPGNYVTFIANIFIEIGGCTKDRY